MIKEHIHDLFTEGLGNILFMPYYRFLKKSIKNKSLMKVLLGIHVICYLLIVILVIYVIFKMSFPL